MVKNCVLMPKKCIVFLFLAVLSTSLFVTVSISFGQNNFNHEKSPYLYDPAARREPFISPRVQKKKAMKSLPSAILPKQDLKDLRLLGIMSGMIGYRAMIEMPGGKRHILASGSLVGSKGWKVKEINKDSLVLEKIHSSNGQPRASKHQTISLSFSD